MCYSSMLLPLLILVVVLVVAFTLGYLFLRERHRTLVRALLALVIITCAALLYVLTTRACT